VCCGGQVSLLVGQKSGLGREVDRLKDEVAALEASNDTLKAQVGSGAE
jgi:hypothetical protein